MTKKILFVCNGNAQRSPTFERYFKDESYKDSYDIRSAGIYSGYPYIINDEIIKWADKIYVMDLEQYFHIFQHYGKETEIIGVSDQYTQNDPELLSLIGHWFKYIKKGFL